MTLDLHEPPPALNGNVSIFSVYSCLERLGRGAGEAKLKRTIIPLVQANERPRSSLFGVFRVHVVLSKGGHGVGRTARGNRKNRILYGGNGWDDGKLGTTVEDELHDSSSRTV